MAKNEKFNEEDGVWRTIGGRRVFIRNGQSLSDAMKESGKFSRVAKNQELYKKVEEENKKDKEEENKPELSEKQKEAGEKLNQNAENGVREDIKSFLSGKENYDGSREDFINDLSNEWGVDKEKVEEILHEENLKHPRNFTSGKKPEVKVKEGDPMADLISKQGINAGGRFREMDAEAEEMFEALDKIESEKNLSEDQVKFLLHAKYYDTNEDSMLKRFRDWQSSSKNDEGSGEIELTDNNFKNNWQDEIKTKEQLLEKEKEVKEQYENYKELVAKNNWNSTTVAKNEESYKKTLQNIEDWKKEFDAQEQGFTSKSTNPFYPDKEYSKEDLDRMAENGVKPMKDTYSGNGWEGVNSNKNLSTKEQAKAITDAMKKKYPDVKISRKSELYSGGSSIHLDIMSSDKDLYVSDADIDKMSLQDLSDVTRSNNFNWWAKENVPGYEENRAMYSEKDVKNYAKERLAQMKKGDNQSVRGDEWYLSDYGKKVVSDLNKEANSYTYDDSDGMTDYFDHGTYMWVNIGKYDKPYQVNQKSTNETMNNAIREKAKGDPNKADVSYKTFLDKVVKGENEGQNYVEWKASQREKASSNDDNKSIKQLNNEMLGNTYKGKGQTPDLVYSNGRRIDIANNENGGKTATIWKDGKIERKTNLPENVSGDKTKDYFDKYLKDLDDMSSNNNQISNSLREKAYKKYLKEHPGSKITFEQYKDMRKQ